jgi:hypothetical protein
MPMKRALVLLLLTVLLAAASPIAASTTLEGEVQAATGIVRQVDVGLQARAAVRAVEIQSFGAFEHCCLSYGEGEVIAWNTTGSLGWMVAGWLSSAGHAAVLLNPDYTRIGCAVAYLAAAVAGVTGSAGWYGVCILSALPATIPNTAMDGS